jgi:ABC-type branched-subunit amino acid transport system substrate-binding protein
VSRDLENAARLAIADLEGVAVDLRVYPTGGTAGGAQSAARQAADEGALILLGPLYAEAANAAGRTVAGDGLNVLAFSNNADIAGGNVFVLGNTFDNVAGRLTAYAARQGKGDIFLVNAQTTAEEVGRDAVARAAANNRASIVGTLSFGLNESAIRSAAPRIAEQVRATGARSLFFTSGNAGAMAFLPQYLREQGVTSETTQFIGLTRLDIPPEALSQPGLQGAWFALPDPALQSNFRRRYAQAYGGQPHPLAGLAYDGIAAIGALAARGDALSRSSLTTGSGFVGVNGIFRLRGDGTNERGLAVAQIRNNQVVVIDPAPRRFGGAGL